MNRKTIGNVIILYFDLSHMIVKSRTALFNIFILISIIICKNNDGSLSHQVFRKKTHTEQYLHASSHHFPAQKLGILERL